MKGGFKWGDILIRYLILFVTGILSTSVFYIIFIPLTIYPVFFLLNIFFRVSLTSNVIMFNSFPIEIIGACVAGSAYYLLLILNLSTPKINLKKRIGILLFSFLSLLVINILRIFLLSILYVSGFSFFDLAHKLFWYLGSVLFVVLIWFLSVKLFKVQEIPFYSDVISLLHIRKKQKDARVKIRKRTAKKRH